MESLVMARPRIVYINIDSPRAGVFDDGTAVRCARRVVDELESPCPVKIRTHQVDVGLCAGVVSALD